jgi:hypothetical protein
VALQHGIVKYSNGFASNRKGEGIRTKGKGDYNPQWKTYELPTITYFYGFCEDSRSAKRV